MEKTKRESLTYKDIVMALAKILVHYPESQLTGESIGMVAEDYLEAFEEENVSVASFHWAVKDVKKRCKFFPKIADFLDSVRAYRANPPRPKQDATAIAYDDRRDWTEEEMLLNQQKVSVLMAQAMGKITEAQANEEIKELDQRIMEFKGTMETKTK